MSSMSQLLMLLWCVVRTAGVWQERCRNVIVVPFRRAISHRNLCWAQPAHQKIIPDFLKIFFFILWPVVIYHDDCLLKTCDVAQDTKSTWKHAESARARLHACKVSYVWLLCMRLDAKCKCLTYESESSWVLFASTAVCVCEIWVDLQILCSCVFVPYPPTYKNIYPGGHTRTPIASSFLEARQTCSDSFVSPYEFLTWNA